MSGLIPFIEAIGYLGIFAIILIETGIIFGFFFPGDTLLQSFFFYRTFGTSLDLWRIFGVLDREESWSANL